MNLTSAIAAARATASEEHAWWIAAHGKDDTGHDVPLAVTLDALASAPPKRIDLAIDDDQRPAWHWLILARAIGATQPVKASIGSAPLFVEGSLHIKGPLKLKSSLVVTGDLVIDGPLIDVVERWHRLIVGGNLEAHAIASSQTILVGGDCTVRDLLWGFEMHDPLAIRGAIRTALLVLSDHRPARFGSEQIATKLENAELDVMTRHFDPALLRGRNLKTQAVVARLLANKPFGPPAPRTKPATAKPSGKTTANRTKETTPKGTKQTTATRTKQTISGRAKKT